MNSKPTTVNKYMEQISDNRKEALEKLRKTILENLPKGFSEVMSYGMPSYVVPHSVYPAGYHCNPKEPLPFMSFASQKSSITLYHMGIYADKKLSEWFVQEYSKHTKNKLEVGKSCIHFKKPDQIPYTIIAELVTKMQVTDWIRLYESNLRK